MIITANWISGIEVWSCNNSKCILDYTCFCSWIEYLIKEVTISLKLSPAKHDLFLFILEVLIDCLLSPVYN